MLKTIVLGVASLFLITGAALADKRDVNDDGQVSAWEIHQYYTDRDSKVSRY